MRSINVYKFEELDNAVKDKAVNTVMNRYSKSLLRTFISRLLDESTSELKSQGFTNIEVDYRQSRYHFKCTNPDVPKILDELKVYYDKSDRSIIYDLKDIEFSEYYSRLDHRHILSYCYIDEVIDKIDESPSNEASLLLAKIVDYLESLGNVMSTQTDKYKRSLNYEYFYKYSIDHNLEFTEDGSLVMIKSR